MDNKIEVFQGNSNTVVCSVTGLADLVGYTATMTVKADLRDEMADALFTVSETSIDGLNITFDTTAVHNDQTAGNYMYEVTITDGTLVYTVVQDVYEIKDR